MASYGRKRQLETRIRGKETVQPKLLKEALPGGAFAKNGPVPQPKSTGDFEAALNRAASGDADVVQVWTDFALWAKKLPGKEQLTILHRACHSLAADKQHAQDIRQLRLWVMLADKESRPAEIFERLEARGIGTSHALLFEAWAHCLEARHDFEGAAAVYRRGLTSQAQPEARLRARRADFDERMRQRVTRTSRMEPILRTPPRENRPWRLSHFRAIKTSLKRPSRLSLLRIRTPRKNLGQERRALPVPRLRKEPAPSNRSAPAAEVAVQRRQLSSDSQASKVDGRFRLTCRKQIKQEAAAANAAPTHPTKTENSEKQSCEVNVVNLANQHAQAATGVVQKEDAPVVAAAQSFKPQSTRKVAPSTKPEPPKMGLLGWLVPFGGLFRRDDDEEDCLEDCEEESIVEDDETDEFPASPPAKRRRMMSWLPW